MKAYPQCVPCLINQGLNAVRKLNLGKEKEKEIALKSVKFLSQFKELEYSPAYYAYFIQKIVKEIAGTEDPFKEQKKIANKKAMELYDELKKIVMNSEDSLATAIKVSAIGNLIDFAVRGEFDIEKEVKEFLNKDFAVWDYEIFKEKLKDAKTCLILGDNAGEIVFDKLLAEELKNRGKEVIYCVKGKPILNDATLEDAEEVSLTSVCRVIDNGTDRVGTPLEHCSQEFLKVFYSADIVISKGQANFETLNDADRNIFFLFVAKCEPIATESSSSVKAFVFKFHKGVKD